MSPPFIVLFMFFDFKFFIRHFGELLYQLDLGLIVRITVEMVEVVHPLSCVVHGIIYNSIIALKIPNEKSKKVK